MGQDRKTRVLRVNPEGDLSRLEEAAAVLRTGGLVVFPTETVYGLGAHALDQQAVQAVFTAKGRPGDNPLIVHIASPRQVDSLVREVTPAAWRLIGRFWPGPLTLVLRRRPHVPDVTTGGLDTVAVRMPAHPVALALIKAAGVPVAAPSANLSGRPSPTSPEDVLADMEGRVDLVVAAGPTEVGLESTVLDLTQDPPAVLRPGGVTLEMIREEAPDARWAGDRPSARAGGGRSPGTRYQHYAPRAPLVVVEGPEAAIPETIARLARDYTRQGLRVGIMAARETASGYPQGLVRVVGNRQDLRSVARGLFGCLRSFDALEVDLILAEGYASPGLGLAIMNRLRQAAGFRVVRAGEPGANGQERER